jgi:intergrase/recombinase
MRNMSYCRFENTSNDLEDCLSAITNRNIKSERERDIAKRMLKEFLDFCQDAEIIDDYSITKIIEVIEECT